MASNTPSSMENPGNRPFSLSAPAGVDPYDVPMDTRRTPTPAPPREDPRELARRLVEQARAKAPAPVAAVAPAPPAETAPPAKKSLASRTAKVLSPEEAIAAAKKAEIDRQAQEAAASKARSEAAERAKQEVAKAKEAARQQAAQPKAPVDREDWLQSAFPGLVVTRSIPVHQLAVFKALWTAHRARASATHDFPLLVTSAALLDASERIPAGTLVAYAAQWQGRSVAVWVDASRPTVLATAEPAELYLAGL